MADECISVYFESSDSFWNYCWEDTTPDPSWIPSNVETGLRKSNSSTARAWKTCQYYMNGMPAICKWWTEGSPDDEEGTVTSGVFYCSYIVENTSDNPQDPAPQEPSGFNFAQCDFLGRRHWCDKYERSVPDNPNEWICTAPNPYLTGLGEKSLNNENAIMTPVPRKRIWGYNDAQDGTGTGKCDCHGFGRGSEGCKFVVGENASPQTIASIENELDKLPIQCNFYRPWQMGFGIIQPAGKEPGDVLADGTITQQGWDRAQAWEDDIEYRLPLNYVLYNKRAELQKCQWWSKNNSSNYIMDGFSIIIEDEAEGDPFDETTGKIEFCTNPATLVQNYNSRIMVSGTVPWNITGSQLALDNIWAKAGGPVCNGCRPDCPGYSGKWLYITNDKMLPGMPVTANQILELRFWSSEWDSKQDYDDYYEHKPNFDDARTSAIYTFTKWKKLDQIHPDRSIMLGKKLDLCLPAPINNRQFTREFVIEEDIEYASITTYGNSTGTNAPEQYNFPSLVRSPEFTSLRPLTVMYPYYNDDVFDADICVAPGLPGHNKKHNTIYGDKVKVIGYTELDRPVYIINTYGAQLQNSLVKLYSGAYKVKNLLRKFEIFNSITDTIESAINANQGYIVQTTSDDTDGHFVSEGVRLMYGVDNDLLICVDLGDGTYEWRWRKVISTWCGGLIQQTSYINSYGKSSSGYNNTQPDSITPGGTADVKAIALGGSLYSEILSSYSFNNVAAGTNSYCWYLAWFTSEALQQNWAAVGNSNLILAEIDDLDVNYLFDWEIVSARLDAITEEDEEGNEYKVGGDNLPDLVELEVYNGIQNDDYLPPNFCMLKPKEDIRYRFLNSYWELTIEYKYKKFIVGNPNQVPEDDLIAGAGSSDVARYTTSPYSVTGYMGSATISNIKTGPVGLLAIFKDFDERPIAANATKLAVSIIDESCRSVEIKYDYYVEGPENVLEPNSGFCVNIAEVGWSGRTRKISETPNCGDHEGSLWVKWEGPLWFPYSSCRGYDLYDEWTICNRCQSGYIGPMNDGVARDDSGSPILVANTALRRNDYRYCGPHKWKAWGEVRSAKPTPCNCGCKFYFADARSWPVNFSGWAALRTTVDAGLYAERGYRMPPYGNAGREYIERYLSQDYEMYWNSRIGSFNTSWMPMVMDNSTLYLPDFNCFDRSTPDDYYYSLSAYPSREPFGYTNQLNYVTGDFIGEHVGLLRLKFNEVFEVHHEGNCSYPLPAYPVGNTTKAVLYHFLDETFAWAWQEHWEDIQREGIASFDSETPTSRLMFIELERPPYRWGVYKTEHQFILDEGAYYLEYTPPEISEDDQVASLPKIAIQGGEPRPFEIIYPEDTYTSDNKVVWKDGGGGAAVDGSSDVDNIYEETGQGPWVHDPDTLFDVTAVSGTEDANSIATAIDEFTGEVTTKYYNKGVIARITRDRLDFLPKQYSNLLLSPTLDNSGIFISGDLQLPVTYTKTVDEIPTGVIGNIIWDSTTIEISPSGEDPFTLIPPYNGTIGIAELKVSGYFGVVKGEGQTKNKMAWPSVNLIATFKDGTTGTPRGYNSATSEIFLPENHLDDGTIVKYNLKMKFALGPLETLAGKRITDFTIILGNYSGYYIAVDYIELVLGNMIVLGEEGQFAVSEPLTEAIFVNERKYLVSTMDVEHNLDGPGDYIKYSLDGDIAGQYFPFTGQGFADDTFQSASAISKMRSVAAGIKYSSDIPIPVNYNSLHEVEAEEQKKIYNWARTEQDGLGDSLSFSPYLPPKLLNSMNEYNLGYIYLDSLNMTSEKLEWDKHALTKQFKQYEYWRPGGHSYEWSQYWMRTNCYIFGPPETIFEGNYRHYDHPYGTEHAADTAVDILNSYYNLRFETMVAKAQRAEILGGSVPTDLLSTANPYNHRL